ncbi:MAG: hypothetical protein EA422_14285 [Gemmatimonadales bacterium]|nr:MAG: hypothetical protein EA422_14285 [Gemmatimonadales bacterium]
MPTLVVGPILLAALMLMGPLSSSLGAAEPTGSVASADSVAVGLHPHLMVMGGVSGLAGDGLHPFGGLEAGMRRGRWGGLVLGQYGYGNDFESVLVAGGPSVGVAEVDRIRIDVHGGPAYYLERLDVGFDRDFLGGYGAVSARVELPIGALGVTFAVWAGRLDGEGIIQASTVTGHRLSVGIGL